MLANRTLHIIIVPICSQNEIVSFFRCSSSVVAENDCIKNIIDITWFCSPREPKIETAAVGLLAVEVWGGALGI